MYTGLIEINSIKGNSGKGNSMFSKSGRMHNIQHKDFNTVDKSNRKPLFTKQPTPPFDLGKWNNFM